MTEQHGLSLRRGTGLAGVCVAWNAVFKMVSLLTSDHMTRHHRLASMRTCPESRERWVPVPIRALTISSCSVGLFRSGNAAPSQPGAPSVFIFIAEDAETRRNASRRKSQTGKRVLRAAAIGTWCALRFLNRRDRGGRFQSIDRTCSPFSASPRPLRFFLVSWLSTTSANHKVMVRAAEPDSDNLFGNHNPAASEPPRLPKPIHVCLPMSAKTRRRGSGGSKCAESDAPRAANSQKVRKNVRAARVKTASKPVPNRPLGKPGGLENEHRVDERRS